MVKFSVYLNRHAFVMKFVVDMGTNPGGLITVTGQEANWGFWGYHFDLLSNNGTWIRRVKGVHKTYTFMII